MSAPIVPAWKRLGLKVQNVVENDPLLQLNPQKRPIDKISTNSNSTTTSKESKDEEQKAKRPPKRVKLPKSERKPPPESDQLAYLRQYTDSKESWKFAKSKQNWVLRHIYSEDEIKMPQAYKEKYLINYLLGIKGEGARSRLVQEAKEVIDRWNQFMSEKDEDKKEGEEENDEKEKKIEEDKKDENEDEENVTPTEKPKSQAPKKKSNTEKKKLPPTENNALLAQNIVKQLSGEFIPLVLINDEDQNKSDSEK